MIAAFAALIVCVAGLVWGDTTLRLGAGIIGLCSSCGFICLLLRMPVRPDVLAGSDIVCAGGLAVLLCVVEFRLWLLTALVAQLLKILLHATAVQVQGRHLASYPVEHSALYVALLAAVLGGLAAALRMRRRSCTSVEVQAAA